jgi:tetratricopeptide (TPR) repeat protein
MVAATGTEAWSMIKHFNINLIISSWDLMPDMSGLVLLKVVRADSAHASIPFLLVVDEITKAQVMEAGSAGVSDIIVRPFNVDLLSKKIENSMIPEDDTKIIETKHLMGQALKMMDQGKFEEALTSFTKVITISETAEAYYNLGFIKTAQGRYEEAIIAFRKATQINQTFAQAYQKMGEAYTKLGRTEEAQKCFEMAAEIYMEKNQDLEAEQVFMKVLEVSPNTPNVYNSLGIVYRRQRKYAEAVTMYRKALRVNPRDEHIHYNLARAYMSVDKYKDAAEVLRNAVKINPDFVEARNLLRSIEMGEGLS